MREELWISPNLRWKPFSLKQCLTGISYLTQQVYCTPAKTTQGIVWVISVMSALVNLLLHVLIPQCTQIRLASYKHRQVRTRQQRLGCHRLAYVLTSDCRAPSSTMMPLVDWSLFCNMVVRLQSKKSPRHFCFTSGRVMNLYSDVHRCTQVWEW